MGYHCDSHLQDLSWNSKKFDIGMDFNRSALSKRRKQKQ
jgi:hypothetical protein